eukprot:704804-Hanusia_phi.AAC.1
MFEIQPDAQGMWEEHLEWLFDMYEGRVAPLPSSLLSSSSSASASASSKRDEQRAALALLFRNMAKHNFAIMQPHVGRAQGRSDVRERRRGRGGQDEKRVTRAQALYEIAKKDPKPMLGSDGRRRK